MKIITLILSIILMATMAHAEFQSGASELVIYGQDAAGLIHPVRTDTTGQIITTAATLPQITSFTNDVGSIENGRTISETNLSWSVNKVMTSQTLNQSIGAISAAATSYQDLTPYTATRTYTLTVSDGTNTANASTSVTFKNSNYYGGSSGTTVNDATINAMTATLATSRAASFTVALSGQYMYIIYPASYGAATVKIFTFLNNDFTLTVQNHTNASGATVSYNVYRSNNLLTGSYDVQVL